MADSRGRRSTPQTVRRWMLGTGLREWREKADKSREEVAHAMKWSSSKVYRIEEAGTAVDPRDVGALCSLYRVPRPERKRLIQLAHESETRGWWSEYPDVFMGPFVAFEAEASGIRTYEGFHIPGLFQTRAYARAVIRSARPNAPADEIERRTNARIARQAVFDSPSPPKVSAIVSEAALRLLAASAPDLAHEQFDALVKIWQRNNVSLRVLPFSAGFSAARESFAMLSFPHAEHVRLVYVGGQMGGVYIESIKGVRVYEDAWSQLDKAALSEEATGEFLAPFSGGQTAELLDTPMRGIK